MKKIALGDEVYAIESGSDLKDGSEWFGESFEPLQAQRMNYPSGKEFKVHKHVLNPRIIKRTQEAFIVINGKISVEVSDENKNYLGTLEAGPGAAIFVYRGYHLVKVSPDYVGWEIKSGQYTYVSEDKEFLNV